MRVSQQMLFDRYVFNLNTSLTTLMDLNTKAQTQKKINKPSDDPTGMTRILDHRDTLRSLEEYKENISTARGWLGSQDEALMQTSTILTRAKELATQAATGTLDGNNREQISYEMRSLFDQLVGLANTEFEDNSIFAGNKINNNAFQEVMWLTTNDASFGNSTDFTVQGTSQTSVLVQFYDAGNTRAPGANMQLSDGNLGVRYSTDGGKTFKNDGRVDWDGTNAQVVLPSSSAGVLFHGDATVQVNEFSETLTCEGTWMWIRPSVQYLGDSEDPPAQVDQLGPGSTGGTILASSAGSYLNADISVRIDNTSPVTLDQEIEFSYSLDGGINWITDNIANADTSASNATLSVGNGGILYLNSNGGNTLQPGQQFIIRPQVADIDLDITSSDRVTINGIGKDIFGGIYIDPAAVRAADGAQITLGSSNAGRVFQSSGAPKMAVTVQGADEFSKNLFEVMGNLIAFTETNNQTGVQQCLENLKNVEDHVMNQLAVVGGRENRLTVSETIIEGLQLNEKTLISNIEDADVSELMTELAQQQIIYESVLRSTSMIMQMGLSNYI